MVREDIDFIDWKNKILIYMNHYLRKFLNKEEFNIFNEPFKVEGIFYNKKHGFYFKGKGKEISSMLYHEEFQDKYLIENLREGSIFIDVGSHFGRFSLIGSKLVGDKGKVICFEPDERAFNRLRENIEINNIWNIWAFPLCVYHKNSHIKFKISERSDWSSITDHHKETIIKEKIIPTITLNRISQSMELDRIDLIKIDVEGSEFNVLMGSIFILKEFKPKLLLEIHDKKSWENCKWFLEELTYKIDILRVSDLYQDHIHLYCY